MNKLLTVIMKAKLKMLSDISEYTWLYINASNIKLPMTVYNAIDNYNKNHNGIPQNENRNDCFYDQW